MIGGYFGLSPKLEQLIVENRIEAYNFPEGVMTQLYRDIGARKPGTLSRVGLGTYIDPRHGGGRMNDRTTEDIVRLMPIDGEDFLFFKAFPINVALIRGTTADPDGNITTERESLALENLALAIAARNSGGIVIAQVERVAAEGTLDARNVKVPGILVDCVVLTAPEHHMQTYGTQFNPAFSGELRVPPARVSPVELNDRKVIARRAVLELAPNSVINVGVGSIPDQVPLVAGEERVQDLLSLAVDSGVIGGVPMSGLDFGAAVNYQAVIDHACAFDFIDGGGLDAAFLGFGECDALGNVNASKFGKRTPGCGGFIDISQNAKKVVFMGTFNSGGLEVGVRRGPGSDRQRRPVPEVRRAHRADHFQRRLCAAVPAGGALCDRALRLPAGRPRARVDRSGAWDRPRARLLQRLPFSPVIDRSTRNGSEGVPQCADATARADAGPAHGRPSQL